MRQQPKQAEGKAGRKETLTLDLAKRIAKRIQQFPDTEIAVTWKNVIEQVHRRFGMKLHRNTLSQKEWDGRNPIVEAFKEAEAVEKRIVREKAPKYADNPRSRLRLIIAKKDAEILALREQLGNIREQQYDEAFSLLDLRTPLRRLVEVSQQPKQAEGKAGRKETLTLDLAKRIAKMIQQFPDAEIAVTWKNVIEQVHRRFGMKLHRNTLSQKEWDGRNPIVEAFKEAEAVEKRTVRENAPKYADNPRSRLRLIIAKKDAEILALHEQLENVRAQQYDEAFSLLDLRTPLHRLVEARGQRPSRRSNSEIGPEK